MCEPCAISQTRVKYASLIVQARSDIFWELVNQILNAEIGGATKKYRNQTLTKVNDVSFRTFIEVKSENKYN